MNCNHYTERCSSVKEKHGLEPVVPVRVDEVELVADGEDGAEAGFAVEHAIVGFGGAVEREDFVP